MRRAVALVVPLAAGWLGGWMAGGLEAARAEPKDEGVLEGRRLVLESDDGSRSIVLGFDDDHEKTARFRLQTVGGSVELRAHERGSGLVVTGDPEQGAPEFVVNALGKVLMAAGRVDGAKEREHSNFALVTHAGATTLLLRAKGKAKEISSPR